jgi:hypothetical protein
MLETENGDVGRKRRGLMVMVGDGASEVGWKQFRKA